jgi:hypothetical protein
MVATAEKYQRWCRFVVPCGLYVPDDQHMVAEFEPLAQRALQPAGALEHQRTGVCTRPSGQRANVRCALGRVQASRRATSRACADRIDTAHTPVAHKSARNAEPRRNDSDTSGGSREIEPSEFTVTASCRRPLRVSRYVVATHTPVAKWRIAPRRSGDARLIAATESRAPRRTARRSAAPVRFPTRGCARHRPRWGGAGTGRLPRTSARSHLPVVVDPSHGTGNRELVPQLALAAAAAGADGLLVDVHIDPASSKCDADQACLRPNSTP